ncbi:putative MFS multidrug transporter [Neurospora crassa]|nr:putative MFS multidrug transporter [Neurospora crassa]
MLSKGYLSNRLDSKAPLQNSAPTVTSSPSFHEHNLDGASPKGEQPTEGPFMSGWRKHVLTLGMWIALFLSTLETTIVSTSLVSITNTLNGFNLRDWVVTAYLITYTGFLIIYAKLGDVFGRKTMYLLGLGIFIIFSCLCGASTNIVELIIFRAFQGMGASGIYCMTIVIAPTLVPKAEFGRYIAIVSTVFALASILGPLLGGVVSANGSWRWVFFLNGPAGGLAFFLLAWLLPGSNKNNQNPQQPLLALLRSKVTSSNLSRVDFAGAVLLLASSMLLVFSLESGGTRYPWSSPTVISTLALAFVTGALFFIWERSKWVKEPVFSPRLLKGRLMPAMLASSFFIGFPFTAIVVNIPQSLQAVYGYSPQKAGIALLPLLLLSPVATAVSGYLTSSRNIPPVYVILVGSVFQLIGVGLTCLLPTLPIKGADDAHVPASQYGFEAIMGIGFGSTLSTILTLAPLVVDATDLPVMMGALTQVRVLGGTISLAVCSTLLNNHVESRLPSLLDPSRVTEISESLSAIQNLPSEEQIAVRSIYAEGYNKQNILLTAFSGIAFISCLLLWERPPRRPTSTPAEVASKS